MVCVILATTRDLDKYRAKASIPRSDSAMHMTVSNSNTIRHDFRAGCMISVLKINEKELPNMTMILQSAFLPMISFLDARGCS